MRHVGRIWLLLTLGAVALLVIGVSGFWADYMWFASLGYRPVFWTLTLTRLVVSLAAFALFFAFFLLNGWMVRRFLPGIRWSGGEEDSAGGIIDLTQRPLNRLMRGRFGTALLVAVSLVVALTLAARVGSFWQVVQRYWYATPFGRTDPVFGLDAGFYIFKLPFYELVQSALTSALVFTLAGSAIIYLVLASGEFFGGGWRCFSPAKLHLGLLVAGLLVVKAWDYRLQAYQLLLTHHGTFWGVGYTDLHARIPALNALVILSLVAAVLVGYGVVRGRLRPVYLSVGALVAAAVLLGWAYPAFVQQFQVVPNEFSREQPFLKNLISATRYAYGLERVQLLGDEGGSGGGEGSRTVDQNLLQARRETLVNLRLWDFRPISQVYNQLQQLRRYYSFQDVDVDRYRLGGDYRQVMLSVRELRQDNLPERARTWVNRRQQYTHGFGAVVSPVNEMTPEGLPLFLVQDIPPRSQKAELRINRPEVYFGELTGNWVVVNTREKEFNYPSGDNNVYSSYSGHGGVRMGGFLRRLLFAARFQDLRLLLSNDITPESRVLYNRTVKDAARLAPYLEYDGDPYPVISQGRIFWIWDAYTTTDHFPYSEAHNGYNYIRNSVKVVVDAYQGDISFYVSDPTDPLIRTYSKIYPSLYRPLSSMPADLRAHLRYPVDLFKTQAAVFALYHISDPRVFYNREDEWAVPNEKFTDGVQPIEPYYAIMQLPGEEREEFVLVLPYTPVKRENLVAWMAARCDGENYGRLAVEVFSKDVHVYGPMQVEATIDQDAEISQALTLWNQQGSQVIRGNLITVPLGDRLLYVEPIFLQARESSLPELIRVILFYDGRVVMANDLPGALQKLFGATGGIQPGAPQGAAPGQQTGQAAVPAPSELSDLARQADQLYNRALERQRQGDWAGYGQAIEQLGRVLDQMTGQGEKSGT